MSETAPTRSPREAGGAAVPPTPPVTITPGAAIELRKALGKTEGVAVRLWVEPGMHPKALMAVDRISPHDAPIEIEGMPVILDPPSLRFLEGAQIRFWANRNPPAFEVVGPNLPAVEEPAPSPTEETSSEPTPRESLAQLPHEEREARIRKAWKKVYDPEIPMNIVDLGLIYATRWTGDDSLEVDMTMTSPGCPVAEMLVQEVEKAAHEAGGVSAVKVSVVWDPPWDPRKMSELAQRQLGFL